MKKLMPWIIIGNAIIALTLGAWLLISLAIKVIYAPDCDGSRQQPVCREVKPIEATSTKVTVPPTSSEVEAKLNEYRTSQGLATFNTEVPALDQAAQARAEGMCTDNDWSHAKDWAVLGQYYGYHAAGENLYYGSLQDNQAATALTKWINSPTHLANIVGSYNEVGVGVKPCPGFQGNQTAVIITNYFGVPR